MSTTKKIVVALLTTVGLVAAVAAVAHHFDN